MPIVLHPLYYVLPTIITSGTAVSKTDYLFSRFINGVSSLKRGVAVFIINIVGFNKMDLDDIGLEEYYDS